MSNTIGLSELATTGVVSACRVGEGEWFGEAVINNRIEVR